MKRVHHLLIGIGGLESGGSTSNLLSILHKSVGFKLRSPGTINSRVCNSILRGLLPSATMLKEFKSTSKV